ncbi:PadR family transcriptional regulator [Paenibacillus pinistramenti]|uniref:PadR family transcriptional regulator n=1 Tax=Paenibacillus pinistramenti TaxID=1768003 RepID=UPI001396C8E7|nr:PadR family transcriptional regulator [Paenibacillus pinistramenti]
MNGLSYALLAMLVRKPCSGYELAKMMEVFWQAKHSQIYPLLAKLEDQSLLTSENVEQTGKPNKKIYYITDTGRDILKTWASKPPALPVTRDEFLIKAYALSLSNLQMAERLFHDRIAYYQHSSEARRQKIAGIIEECGGKVPQFGELQFGRYIVHNRKLRMEEEEIAWCNWVLGLLGLPAK